MKTRLTSAALCAAALTFALPNLLFSQIYTPGGNVLSNTGGNNIGIGTNAPAGKLVVRADAALPSSLIVESVGTQGSQFDPDLMNWTYADQAFRIVRVVPDIQGTPGTSFNSFAIDAWGRTTIGTFPAAAPDMLAVNGSIGLFNTPTNFARIRCTGGLGTEIIWSNSNNRNLSFKNEQTGLIGMLLTPGGKFAVGSTALDGEHRLRAKGSAVAEVLQVQVEGDWGTNNNTLGLSTDQGNHVYWRTPSQKLEFRSEGNTPLVLHSSGKVGINTDYMPDNHSLYVKGSMIIEEVIVKDFDDWGDFVFEPDYPLMPLAELDTYLAEHKHLPEFPSARDVAENGLALGETQRLLTIKVEELTLYLLQMSKEMEALREEITTLRGEK